MIFLCDSLICLDGIDLNEADSLLLPHKQHSLLFQLLQINQKCHPLLFLPAEDTTNDLNQSSSTWVYEEL